MNCVEFRRHLGADPQSNAVEFVRHRAECPRCADAAGRAGEFDRSLLRALNIEAPAQLADSILLAQATAERRRRATMRRGAIFAIAASLALAVGMVGMRVEAKPLSAQAVEHLHEEASKLALTADLPPAEIRDAFTQRGLSLHDVPAGISFVGCCPMGKHRTVHMVMPNAADPVTVIYVVDKRVGQREDFQRDGLQGRSVPLGAGTLILLAKSSSTFDHVEAVWSEALAAAPTNG